MNRSAQAKMTGLLLVMFCSIYIAVQAQKKIKLEGIESPYSDQILAHFNSEAVKKRVPSPTVNIVCIQTEGDPLYIGVQQEFIIKAPLKRVVDVLEDFDNYPMMFEDIIKAVFTKKADDYYMLWQEQKFPIPFLSNIVYTQSYYIENTPSRKRYLYKLYEGGKDAKYDDGMIQLKKLGENECSFYELDFVDADWSIIGKIAPGTIWKAAVKGAIESNMIIKTRAENPTWSMDDVKDEANRIVDQINFSEIVANKKYFKDIK
jgi:hypothetical protein